MSEENEVVPEDEVVEETASPTLASLNAGQTITFELLEEFTGKRNVEVPDPNAEEMEEPEMVLAVEECSNIMVKFTDTATDKETVRAVNVCFDADGKYDETATLVRVSEVREGIGPKFALNIL